MSQQQDKAFVRTFIGVIAVLVAITVGLILLASSTKLTSQDEERAELERDRALERLQPIAAVRLSSEPMPEIATAQVEEEASGPKSGEEVVTGLCASCHATGLLEAPKIGTAADWEPRMAQGLDALVANAINGIRAMPPRGGDASLSDEEVRAAVVHMLEQSGISAN